MAVERVVVADRTAFLRRPDHRVVRALALLESAPAERAG